jgi:hypothetical protein
LAEAIDADPANENAQKSNEKYIHPKSERALPAVIN